MSHISKNEENKSSDSDNTEENIEILLDQNEVNQSEYNKKEITLSPKKSLESNFIESNTNNVDNSKIKESSINKNKNFILSDNETLYPSAYDIDIDSFDEKPWRTIGADITDWFNYGFTEESWRAYCARQVEMRLSLKLNMKNISKNNESLNSKNNNMNKKNKRNSIVNEISPNKLGSLLKYKNSYDNFKKDTPRYAKSEICKNDYDIKMDKDE